MITPTKLDTGHRAEHANHQLRSCSLHVFFTSCYSKNEHKLAAHPNTASLSHTPHNPPPPPTKNTLPLPLLYFMFEFIHLQNCRRLARWLGQAAAHARRRKPMML